MTRTFGRYDRESYIDYLDRVTPLKASSQEVYERNSARAFRQQARCERIAMSSRPVTLPRLKFLENGSDE